MGKKGDLTRRKILDTAAYCLSQYGEHGTTFQKIADHCGLSQPYIVKFFKTRDEIFPRVFQDFLERAREETTQATKIAEGAEKKLRAYFQISYQVLFEKPESFRLYSNIYYLATFNQKYKDMNSQVKAVAVERILSFLKEGNASGEFKIAEPEMRAKTIHNNALGLFLNVISENPHFTPRKLWLHYVESTIAALKAGL